MSSARCLGLVLINAPELGNRLMLLLSVSILDAIRRRGYVSLASTRVLLRAGDLLTLRSSIGYFLHF